MARLPQQVRKTVRQGNLFPVVVLDEGGGKATVRLSSNGAVYRMLPLVGGPVSVGQNVHIDFSTDPPQVIAPAITTGFTEGSVRTLARAGSSSPYIGEDSTFLSGITVLRPDASRLYYPVTEEGFYNSLQNSYSGCLIYLPTCNLTSGSGWVIDEGISIFSDSAPSTILNGNIVLGNGCSLQEITVNARKDNGDDIIAILGPTSGSAVIDDCYIDAICCTSGSYSGGTAIGIQTGGSGKITVVRSKVYAESDDGDGYAIDVSPGGQAWVIDTEVYGSTENFLGTSIYVHNAYEGETKGVCSG